MAGFAVYGFDPHNGNPVPDGVLSKLVDAQRILFSALSHDSEGARTDRCCGK